VCTGVVSEYTGVPSRIWSPVMEIQIGFLSRSPERVKVCRKVDIIRVLSSIEKKTFFLEGRIHNIIAPQI
jgi:hypothetical protein